MKPVVSTVNFAGSNPVMGLALWISVKAFLLSEKLARARSLIRMTIGLAAVALRASAEMITVSKPVPAVPFQSAISHLMAEALFRVRTFTLVRVPIPALPGAKVPSRLTAPSRLPVPPRVPAVATVTAELFRVPFTNRLPSLTLVVPV